MRTTLFIILIVNSVNAQLNGEFWWLNKKLVDYRNVQPEPPQFEVLSDFDTDENAKIVFRDHDFLAKPFSEDQKSYDYTSGKIVWPTHKANIYNVHNNEKENIEVVKLNVSNNAETDELVFTFPGTETYASLNTKKDSPKDMSQATTAKIDEMNGEILHNDDKILTGDKEAQHICSYIKKNECFEYKGIIYKDWHQKDPEYQQIVCCILPIQPMPKFNEHFIYFPGKSNKKLRHKRSNDGTMEKERLNQRNYLLIHKFTSQHRKNPLTPAPTPKIVTPTDEEYSDPYWNIKNSKFQTDMNQKIQTPAYNNDDYEGYVSELPAPGLIGLYSDHVKSPSSWSYTSSSNTGYSDFDADPIDYEDDDEEFVNIGYATIDPRKSDKNMKIKPVKTTVSEDVTLGAESHTINFQSNPDFQVLQGFKLLNLFKNRSRVYKKKSRKTTTERFDDKKEFLGARPSESSEIGDEFFEEDQLFGGCGKASMKLKDTDTQVGVAANGSHPWMALVVLSKRRQNVLCYATLIHPRAAITVADCVHGTSPRDITAIFGAWNLNDKSRLRNRVVSIQVHPRYKPGESNNNLAILYWMRPLELGANIQPACVGEPHVGDDCKFFGWGNLNEAFIQGIRPRSKWQRASIRLCETRGNKRAKPSETFCATVPRGSVTSLGGPLICDIDGHNSAVGIVVEQDNDYVLMPIREFAMMSTELLSGD